MSKRMTARQRECQIIAEAKAKQIIRRTAIRRCVLGGAAIVLMGGVALTTILTSKDGQSNLLASVAHSFYSWTAHKGFAVKNVYLEGRNHTPMDKVQQALQLTSGSPIFAESPQDIRTRLEALDRVQYAEVERVLPSTLHIHIVEREPIAIWQNKGNLRLIDNTGRIMEDVSVSAYTQLPVVTGENAPSHAPELFGLMAQEPELLRQVASAIRVGERRWNVRFKNGIEIKLPESEIKTAWETFVTMQEKDKVLDKAISAVDLRLSNRVFLKLSEPETQPDSNNILPVSSQKDTKLPAGSHET